MERPCEMKRLMQIGIIVTNIEESVAYYEELGMGPWEITEMRNDCPPFEGMTLDGEELPEKGIVIKTAMITCYGIEFELIEPVMDTRYKKWLEEHGPGIHHLAFETATPYPELLRKAKAQNGKDPWVRGYGIGGEMDFSYLDLRKEMGIIMECYGKMVPGKPGVPYGLKGDFVSENGTFA